MRGIRLICVLAISGWLACAAAAAAQQTSRYGTFGPRSVGGTLTPRERTRFGGGIQRGPSGNILGLQREHPRFTPSIPAPPAMEEFMEVPPRPRVPVPVVPPRVPPRVPRIAPPEPVEPAPPPAPPAFPRRLERAPARPAPTRRAPREPAPDIWFRAPRNR